jgi:DNA-binding CsgD family transcriptional regulator
MKQIRERVKATGWLRLSVLLEMLQALDRHDDVAGIMEHVRTAYGLAHVTFLVTRAGISPQRYPLLFTTYPRGWTEIYKRQNYFEIDPVIRKSETAFLPFHWDSLGERSPQLRAFFAEAKLFRIGHQGLTVPIRAANGERALFSVTSNRSRRQWRRQRALIAHELMVFASFFHDQLLVISGLRETALAYPLSRREQQCMELLARGSQVKQIADSLEISDSAVRKYIRAAKRKLGARTPSQAAARASLIEIIRI